MVVIGGSPAIHKLGDIHSDIDDIFVVHHERDDILIGNWLEGFGLIDVEVQRAHTRKLTHAEADKLHGGYLAMSGRRMGQVEVDVDEVEDGWVPKVATQRDVAAAVNRLTPDTPCESGEEPHQEILEDES